MLTSAVPSAAAPVSARRMLIGACTTLALTFMRDRADGHKASPAERTAFCEAIRFLSQTFVSADACEVWKVQALRGLAPSAEREARYSRAYAEVGRLITLVCDIAEKRDAQSPPTGWAQVEA